MKHTPNSRSGSGLSFFSRCIAASAIFATASLQAQDVWDGGGADDNLSTDLNWVDDTAPASGQIRFDGETRLTPNNDLVGATFGEIQFINDGTAGKTGEFTLTGNSITLNAAIRTTTSTLALEDDIQLDLILNNNRSVITFGSHDVKISGNISGAHTVTIGDNNATNSEGLVTLSGTNTHNQTTVGRNGQLRIESDAAIGNRLFIGRNTDVFLADGVTLNPSNGIGFQDSANSHILKLEDAGATTAEIASEVDVQISGTANSRTASINIGDDDTLTISGQLTSNNTNTAKRLFKGGAGTLILSNGSNDYEGILRIDNGSVELQHSLALQATRVQMNGGAVDFDDATVSNAATFGSLLGSSGLSLQTDTGGALTLTLAGLVGDNYTGVISDNGSGGGSIVKIGAGTQVFSGTNTYGGTTTISGGILRLGNAGTTGSLLATTGITNNASLLVNRTNTFTQATDLNGQPITGTGSFTQLGTGTTTLSAANTYTGATSVNAGTLEVTGSLTSDITVNAGGILGGEGSTTGSVTLASGSTLAADPNTGGAFTTTGTLAPTATVNVVVDGVAPSSSPFTVINYGTYGGTVGTDFTASGARSPVFADTGTSITLSVAVENNTWQGGDVTNPTFWDINTTANWSNSTDSLYFDTDAVTFGDTGVGAVAVQEPVTAGSITFTNTSGNNYTLDDLTANVETISAGGGINITGDGDVTMNVKITGNTSITHSGTGTLGLGGGAVNNDFVGTITVDGGGTLKNLRNQDNITSLGNAGNTFSFSNGSTFDLNSISTHDDYQNYGTGSFVFGDGTTITNSGTSTNDAFGDQLVLEGDVTFDGVGRFDITGDIAVTGTDIVITAENNAGNVIFTSNTGKSIAEWVVNDGILFASNDTAFGDAVVTINTDGAISGNIGSGTDIGNGPGVAKIGNAITLNGGWLRANQNNTTSHYSGAITVTADSTINPFNANRTIILSGSLAESGSGGDLTIGVGTTRIASTFDASGFTGDFFLNGTGNFDLEDTVNLTQDIVVDDANGNKVIRVLTGNSAEISGGITVNEASAEDFDLFVQDAADTLTVSGVISGSGAAGVTKTGPGGLILEGVNTYTGSTFIYAGVVTLVDDAQLTFAPAANGVNNQVAGNAAGTLDLEGDIYLDLSGADTTGGNSWTLIDGSLLLETYGATFTVNSSEGVFTEDTDVWTLVDGPNTWTFTEATGVLTLDTVFSTWATTNSATNDPDANDDADSLVNIIEFAFGTDPLVSDESALIVTGGTFTVGTPVVNTSFGPLDVKARFIRLVDYANSGITYTVQFSNDLNEWEGVPGNGSTGVRISGTSAQGDYEVVEVDYPLFLSTGKKAQFFRLSINSVDAD